MVEKGTKSTINRQLTADNIRKAFTWQGPRRLNAMQIMIDDQNPSNRYEMSLNETMKLKLKSI